MGFCKTHGHVHISENCVFCIKCDWCTNKAEYKNKGSNLCYPHMLAVTQTVV